MVYSIVGSGTSCGECYWEGGGGLGWLVGYLGIKYLSVGGDESSAVVGLEVRAGQARRPGCFQAQREAPLLVEAHSLIHPRYSTVRCTLTLNDTKHDKGLLRQPRTVACGSMSSRILSPLTMLSQSRNITYTIDTYPQQKKHPQNTHSFQHYKIKPAECEGKCECSLPASLLVC